MLPQILLLVVAECFVPRPVALAPSFHSHCSAGPGGEPREGAVDKPPSGIFWGKGGCEDMTWSWESPNHLYIRTQRRGNSPSSDRELHTQGGDCGKGPLGAWPRLDGYWPILCCPRVPLSASVSASPKLASAKVFHSVPSGCSQCPSSLPDSKVAGPGSPGEG